MSPGEPRRFGSGDGVALSAGRGSRAGADHGPCFQFPARLCLWACVFRERHEGQVRAFDVALGEKGIVCRLLKS